MERSELKEIIMKFVDLSVVVCVCVCVCICLSVCLSVCVHELAEI